MTSFVGYSKTSIQFSSTAPSITSILQSCGTDSLFTGLGVNEKTKKIIDQKTNESLSQFNAYGKHFMFHTVKLYARPIQDVGTHIADNNNNNDLETNKNNAYKASRGFHHGLLILTHNSAYEPLTYVLDRVEGIRFIKVQLIESEL
eukprot:87244_1